MICFSFLFIHLTHCQHWLPDLRFINPTLYRNMFSMFSMFSYVVLHPSLQTNICCEHLRFLVMVSWLWRRASQCPEKEREGAALIVMRGVGATLPPCPNHPYHGLHCRVGPLKHHTLHTAGINQWLITIPTLQCTLHASNYHPNT